MNDDTKRSRRDKHQREMLTSMAYAKARQTLSQEPDSPEAKAALERAKTAYRTHQDATVRSRSDLIKAIAPSWGVYIDWSQVDSVVPDADLRRAEFDAYNEGIARLQAFATMTQQTVQDVLDDVNSGVLTASMIRCRLADNPQAPSGDLSVICPDRTIRDELNAQRGSRRLSDQAVEWLKNNWRELLPDQDYSKGVKHVSNALKCKWGIRISRETVRIFRSDYKIFK